MKILAIETSCDETAAAVVQDGRRELSGMVASQVEEHRLYGGVVPEIASRRHAEAISRLTREALDRAGTGPAGLDAVAVTAAPGLIGALLVGVNFAKGISMRWGLPLIPVHHLRAHIAAAYLAYPELSPPFLCLVVSGGHTHLVVAEDYTRFRVLGRTRDDAAGECFDKAARAMGLPYPGGIEIDRLAAVGDRTAFKLPIPKIPGLDFSFSGIKTAVINLIHNNTQKGGTLPLADLAASFQHTVCDILCTRTMQAAAALTSPLPVVLTGGVAANAGLRKMMAERCAAAGYPCYLPPLRLCGDNAAMVGAQAYYEYQAGHTASMSLNAAATMGIENNF
ncbi:MAG: tRNA (adenosine(37)-N6)-threonylcarbamoyltransferase complex transferase subunit TsaD [Oscillospiraceae bacterium]|nr:tRNA (adenosine(37)-N6)-threonylcarbamoyltransferase complex transferase subunit TsaD [Oscillospiraceae bacterium]